MSDGRIETAGDVPSAIGRYQIIGALGFGAMGAVYKAFDPLIKRTLAIKTIRLDIPRHSPQYQAFIDRFYQEVRISGTLSHPGIVTLFDVGEENGLPFLAMEYVDGRTIGAMLEDCTRFKPERVIGLVSQVAAALDYAHSRRVVHRDIKPSNLIVGPADEVKVTDFGIAKLADAEITHAGALLGTPSYMSPEQAMGEKLDGRSDIFSLGVVAFQMLSGQQPFPGANITSILYKLVHVDPVEPADLETSGLVPQKWREVFNKVLAKKPERRYQTASAFVQDLEYCLGSWFAGLGTQDTMVVAAPPGAETAAATSMVPGPDPATVLLAAADDGGEGSLAPFPAEASLAPPAEASLTLPPGAEFPDGTAEAPRRLGHALLARWALGGFALVALTVTVAAWTLWPRSRVGAAAGEAAAASVSPVPSPTAPASPVPLAAPPQRGALRVQSDPPGALVTVNGEMQGETPLRLADLPFGHYKVRVERQGYESQARDLSISAEAATGDVQFVLKRPPAVQGEIDVVSTPSGGSVFVDGRRVGTTPLTGMRLKPGRRRLDVALDGHQTWSGAVDVAAGGTGRVEARLEALPRPAEAVTPEPVDVARVYDNSAEEVDTLAKRLSGISPSYPAGRAARLKSGERVSVLVRFVVTEAGEVRDVSVLQSGGGIVDDVVVAAIRGWRFQPATKRGTRVKVQVTFKQTFLGG